MPGSGFKFEVAGADFEKLNRIPRKAREVLLDTEALYNDRVHPWMLGFVEKVYDTQGAPTGTKWDDYSDEPKYEAYKSALLGEEQGDLPVGSNKPGGLMRWSDRADYGSERLYPSLTEPSDQDHFWNVSGTEADFGTSVGHAHSAAEEQTEGPRGEPSPPRPILRMTGTWKNALRVEIAGYYHEKLKEVGIDLGPVTTSRLSKLSGVSVQGIKDLESQGIIG